MVTTLVLFILWLLVVFIIICLRDDRSLIRRWLRSFDVRATLLGNNIFSIMQPLFKKSAISLAKNRRRRMLFLLAVLIFFLLLFFALYIDGATFFVVLFVLAIRYINSKIHFIVFDRRFFTKITAACTNFYEEQGFIIIYDRDGATLFNDCFEEMIACISRENDVVGFIFMYIDTLIGSIVASQISLTCITLVCAFAIWPVQLFLNKLAAIFYYFAACTLGNLFAHLQAKHPETKKFFDVVAKVAKYLNKLYVFLESSKIVSKPVKEEKTDEPTTNKAAEIVVETPVVDKTEVIVDKTEVVVDSAEFIIDKAEPVKTKQK